MIDFLAHLFDTSGFPPRWYCGDWSAGHGWLHILSDLGVWSAYLAIPCVLGYFILRRKDIPFRGIFLLFAGFIVACGTTHLMEAIIFWWPGYRLAGVIKLFTAVISWATVFALVPVVPKALAMRSADELEREIAARRQAEDELLKANIELERRVDERTVELTQAVSALRDERELLRTTLGSIGDGVIATDIDQRATFLNPVAESLTGWRNDEAVGRPLDEILHVVNETTRLPVDNPAAKAMTEGVVVSLESQALLIAKDGAERPIDDSAAPIRDEQGGVSGVVLIFRDVAERRAVELNLRRNEERLRLFVEHAPAAVAMLDKDMRYLLVSRRWLADYRLLGEELVGRSHYEVFPDVPQRWKEIHRRCLAGAIERADEDSYIAPDGSEEWQRWEIRPWRDDSGEVGGIIIFSEIITEQRLNRKVVQEHAEALSGILGATVDHIYLVDRSGRYRYVSNGAARVLGFEPTEMVGKHWAELGLPAELMRSFDSQREEVLLSGLPAQHETHFVTPEGERRDFDYTIAPVSGAEAGADAVVVVSRDVTRHKLTERERLELLRELETQNAFINAVLAQVPAAIVVADARTGKLMMSNEESHRIVRHDYHPGSRLEDYGDNYILDAVGPDGSAYTAGKWPLDRALNGESISGEEIELYLRDGSRVTIRVNAGPIRVGEELVAAVVAFHDITERKAVEQSARFLADASAALAGLINYEETLQKVASLAVPTFSDWALVDIAEADGSARRLAVAHSDPSKVDLALELQCRFPYDPAAKSGPINVIRTGRSEFAHEITDEMLVAGAKDENHLRMYREMGPKSYMSVPLTVRNETLGAMTFLSVKSSKLFGEHDLAVAKDLASRAAIAIENARLYAELKEGDRRKDEFLATLAHELRNPLAPIKNGLQVLKLAGDGGERLTEARVMMERQLGQMVRLVDDLLDVSRITRNKLDLRKERVDLATVVESAVETSRPLIEESRHVFTYALPQSPVFLNADPMRLAQVFSNLLNNSAKYTEEEGRISLEAEAEGNEVVVCVRDTGVGIPADALPRIFEMFSQVDRNLERAQGGLGIGLTLVRRLVEMHGGTVQAKSEGVGQGSEFVVRLPLAKGETEVSKSANVESLAKPRRLRVLIVDDNPDGAKSLSLILSLSGHDTRTAFDGLEGIELAESFRPDLILLDIGLPKLNGFETCRRIRQKPWGKDMFIIAVTGWGQEEDRRRSEQAGFNMHTVKPVNFDELEKILTRMKSQE